VLEISKNYAIGSDELNITLYKRRVSENGKKYYQALGYFSSCESALKALVDMEIKGTGLRDLEAVVSKIRELKEVIDGLRNKPLPTLKRR
jgi:hypothetical protein